MTAIHRIEPPIEVETPLGFGRAIFLIDYGIDTNSVWVVALFPHPIKNPNIKHFLSEQITVLPNPMTDS